MPLSTTNIRIVSVSFSYRSPIVLLSFSYCSPIVLLLFSYCSPIALLLFSYCSPIVLLLFSYCSPIVLLLGNGKQYGNDTRLIRNRTNDERKRNERGLAEQGWLILLLSLNFYYNGKTQTNYWGVNMPSIDKKNPIKLY